MSFISDSKTLFYYNSFHVHACLKVINLKLALTYFLKKFVNRKCGVAQFFRQFGHQPLASLPEKCKFETSHKRTPLYKSCVSMLPYSVKCSICGINFVIGSLIYPSSDANNFNGIVCQIFPWKKKNSLYSISIWDTVTKLLPLCSVYQAPSYELYLILLAWFLSECA